MEDKLEDCVISISMRRQLQFYFLSRAAGLGIEWERSSSFGNTVTILIWKPDEYIRYHGHGPQARSLPSCCFAEAGVQISIATLWCRQLRVLQPVA